MHSITKPCSLSFLALTLTASAFAQNTRGSIAGNIADPNQAAVAGTVVTISDETKSFSLTVRLQF